MVKISKWNDNTTPGIGEKISHTLNTEGSLRPRIRSGVTIVHKQKGALDKIISKLDSRDKVLLVKVNMAMKSHDMHTARTRAGELVQLRQVKDKIRLTRLALEKIEMQLSAGVSLGDAITAIAPAIQIMRGLGTMLGRYIPEASIEVNQMANMLGSYIDNNIQGDVFNMKQQLHTDAFFIMKEAASLVGLDDEDDNVRPNLPSKSIAKNITRVAANGVGI